MALHMQLMVNNRQIGYLEARRIEDGRPEPDDVCHYEWVLHQFRVGKPAFHEVSREPLAHRYGDGAWALVRRVVEESGYLEADHA